MALRVHIMQLLTKLIMCKELQLENHSDTGHYRIPTSGPLWPSIISLLLERLLKEFVRAQPIWVTSFHFTFSLFFLLLYNHSCPHFPPNALHCPAQPTPTSTLNPPSVVSIHGLFIHVPWLDPSPSLPCYAPPSSPMILSVCSLSIWLGGVILPASSQNVMEFWEFHG